MKPEKAIELLRALHDQAIQKGLYANAQSVNGVSTAIAVLEQLTKQLSG